MHLCCSQLSPGQVAHSSHGRISEIMLYKLYKRTKIYVMDSRFCNTLKTLCLVRYSVWTSYDAVFGPLSLMMQCLYLLWYTVWPSYDAAFGLLMMQCLHSVCTTYDAAYVPLMIMLTSINLLWYGGSLFEKLNRSCLKFMPHDAFIAAILSCN